MRTRILILFGTSEGQTAKIAGAMAATMRAAGADVDVVRGGHGGLDPRPEDYAGVVVAASVHVGGYQRGVRRWVRAHAGGLGGRPTAFVSVCLGVLQKTPAVDRDLRGILDRFFTATGWRPTETKIVAGALPYSKYGWFKRRIMRNIVARAHGDVDTSRDYEYTDWADVAAFARRFAAEAHAADTVAVGA
jgi:menaquinone-dependent protoporphyrinogen oxidase